MAKASVQINNKPLKPTKMLATLASLYSEMSRPGKIHSKNHLQTLIHPYIYISGTAMGRFCYIIAAFLRSPLIFNNQNNFT